MRQARRRLAVVAVLAAVCCAPAFAGAKLPALPPLSHSGLAADAWTGVDRQPGNPVAGFGSIWVPSSGAGFLDRIDPKSLRVQARVRSASASTAAQNQYFDSVAVTRDAVWHASDLGNTVTRLDPGSNKVVARIPVGGRPEEVAGGPAGVYVGLFNTGTIERIDPRTNKIVRRRDLDNFVLGIAFGAGGVWAVDASGPSVVELDPVTLATRKRISIKASLPVVGGFFTAWWISADAKTVCVGNQEQNAVTLIDPAARTVRARVVLPFGRQPFSVAADRGRCWVTNDTGVVLARPGGAKPAFSHLPANGTSVFTGVAVGAGGAWVTLAGRNALLRVHG